MAELEFTSPPGYGKLVALQRDVHAGHGIKPNLDQRWTASLNAIFLAVEEFEASLTYYPIAFIRDVNTGRTIPVAVLGLGQRGNCYLDDNGNWRSGIYVPGYVRRYPFCLSHQAEADDSARIICVVEDCLDPDAPALLDADGKPTPAFEPQYEFIRAVETAQRKTAAFTAELNRLDLFAPLDEVDIAHSGIKLRLGGLQRIDEQKLQALPPETLHGLALSGYLRAIYAHLLSLDSFARLAIVAARSGSDG